MNKERLRTLVADLRKQHRINEARKRGPLVRFVAKKLGFKPRAKYNQSSWFTGANALKPGQFTVEKLPGANFVSIKESACGTAACVLGQAALNPELREAGLGFKLDRWDIASDGAIEAHRMDIAFKDATGAVYGGFEAGARVFDIPPSHAGVLFGSSSDTKTVMFYTGKNVDDARKLIKADCDVPDDGPEDPNFYAEVNLGVVADRIEAYVRSNGASVESVIEAFDNHHR